MYFHTATLFARNCLSQDIGVYNRQSTSHLHLNDIVNAMHGAGAVMSVLVLVGLVLVTL